MKLQPKKTLTKFVSLEVILVVVPRYKMATITDYLLRVILLKNKPHSKNSYLLRKILSFRPERKLKNVNRQARNVSYPPFLDKYFIDLSRNPLQTQNPNGPCRVPVCKFVKLSPYQQQ